MATTSPTTPEAPQDPPKSSGLARNTVIFSIATGLSRIMGLVREVVASRYFGTGGGASAFTLAFQFPNLVRSLFADAAISAAFVPIFTELLEKGQRKDAAQLATTMLLCIIAALGAITAIFILFAGSIMPIFLGAEFEQPLVDLTIGLSQVLFPIVLLLGVNGLVVGILNAYGHFAVPAIAPLVWNVIIIVALVGAHPFLDGDDELYAYAAGVLVGTLVQLLIALPILGRLNFRFARTFSLRDERVRRVFVLMLPITLSLGVINFDLYINSSLGTLVSEQAPRAIDAAFRIYMLPQGMFSVALATVLFPTLSRYAARKDFDGLRTTMASGSRQIYLCLVPAAVFCAVLATPVTRLVYERGEFDAESTALVSDALFWFSFSLPFAGVNLLLTRTFFSLQRPWIPTALAVVNLIVNVIISLLLYRSCGIAGLVIGTAVASAGMTVLQSIYLKRLLAGSLEGPQMSWAVLRIWNAAGLLGGASYGTWWVIDDLLGRSIIAQVLAVGGAATVGFLVYATAVLALRVPEAGQIQRLISGRVTRSRPAT
ncbi:putative lipid II flippase MurJ [Paraconexibacter sp. AEG42_29]|uniref:Probable lipid II flippase MurJ n=1 Tax=Paraconexibacter sp. AEG42_29 TaxID=2997339 RepID=A0AAU7AXL5_9ACTN